MKYAVYGFVCGLPVWLGMFLAFCAYLRDLVDAISTEGKRHGIW